VINSLVVIARNLLLSLTAALSYLLGFWLGGGSLVTSARAVTIAVVKKHDAAWLRQTLARLPLHIRQTGAPLREGGWSWHKSGKVTHFLILEQKWWDFFAAEYGAEYAVPAAASPSFAAALVCPSPSSAAASSAAAALSSGRSSELSAAASVSVSQEGRKRTASFAGQSSHDTLISML
jgi:hypothetical protein